MSSYSANNDELLTITEAAKFLKVHRETIRRWYLKGELVGLKRGRTLRFTKSDLINYLKGESPKKLK